jgi:hypothetical protein
MARFTQLTIRTGWGKNARKYRRISYPFNAPSRVEAAIHNALEEERVILRLRQRTGETLSPESLLSIEGLVFVPELV